MLSDYCPSLMVSDVNADLALYCSPRLSTFIGESLVYMVILDISIFVANFLASPLSLSC